MNNKEYEEGNVSYELGIDEYSYLSYDEFIGLRTGVSPLNITGIQIEEAQFKSGRAPAPARSAGGADPESFDQYRIKEGVVHVGRLQVISLKIFDDLLRKSVDIFTVL